MKDPAFGDVVSVGADFGLAVYLKGRPISDDLARENPREAGVDEQAESGPRMKERLASRVMAARVPKAFDDEGRLEGEQP
jgi:hypothetical protein